MRRTCVVAVPALAVFAALWLAAPLRADEWEEPKNGLFTEKQIEHYAAAQKDLMQLLRTMGKAVEGSKTGIGAAAVLAGMDDKVNAIVAKHDLKRAEFEWLGSKAFECMGLAMIDEQFDKGKDDLAEQRKKNVADQEAMKKRIADYEKASKEGKRVLTKEQREELVKGSKEAQDSANEEARQHAQEAKEAADEAAKIEGEAKAADALAKNPPPDVDKDSRDDYVKGKKEEAESLRANAKESRDREKEAKKAEAESKAKAAAAGRQIANPEVPVTDEEKEQTKAQNAKGLADARSELEQLAQVSTLLADAEVQYKKQRDEMHKSVKEENLTLVKKHLKELKEAWGMDEKK
jgi:hypothetical protein